MKNRVINTCNLVSIQLYVVKMPDLSSTGFLCNFMYKTHPFNFAWQDMLAIILSFGNLNKLLIICHFNILKKDDIFSITCQK